MPKLYGIMDLKVWSKELVTDANSQVPSHIKSETLGMDTSNYF